MKGILTKFEDRWGVVYDILNPPVGTATKEWLPLDPNYVKYYFLDEDNEGGNVEFTFSEKWYELEGKTIIDKYARLKRPEEQTNGERFEEFMKLVQYPELEGTMNLCKEIIEKRTGKMTEEEWQAAEKTQTSSQTEISDEDIEKSAKEWYEKEGRVNYNAEIRAWVMACKWYREQLKLRNETK